MYKNTHTEVDYDTITHSNGTNHAQYNAMMPRLLRDMVTIKNNYYYFQHSSYHWVNNRTKKELFNFVIST